MDDVEALTSKLIALDSQSHVSNAAVAEFVMEYIDPLADRIERIEYTDPDGQRKISLVAQLGNGEGGLALSAHMDTVPGLEWDSDPFQTRIEDGRMYGLGTCDMKGALACTLVVAGIYPTLNACKRLTLIYTTDEETDTEGARRIVEESEVLALVRPEYCIVAEPIGLSDFEVIKIANEVGKRGLSGMSFICIPPGSAVVYRVIVCVIMYLLAGVAMGRQSGTSLL